MPRLPKQCKCSLPLNTPGLLASSEGHNLGALALKRLGHGLGVPGEQDLASSGRDAVESAAVLAKETGEGGLGHVGLSQVAAGDTLLEGGENLLYLSVSPGWGRNGLKNRVARLT